MCVCVCLLMSSFNDSIRPFLNALFRDAPPQNLLAQHRDGAHTRTRRAHVRSTRVCWHHVPDLGQGAPELTRPPDSESGLAHRSEICHCDAAHCQYEMFTPQQRIRHKRSVNVELAARRWLTGQNGLLTSTYSDGINHSELRLRATPLLIIILLLLCHHFLCQRL